MGRQLHAAKFVHCALVIADRVAAHEELEIIVFRFNGKVYVVGLFLPGGLLLALEPTQKQLVSIDEGWNSADELFKLLRALAFFPAEKPEELLRTVNRVVLFFDPSVYLLFSYGDVGQPCS